MAEPKTKPTDQKPEDFLKTIEPETKRQDGFTLLELFKKITGEKPRMWGTSIVGFGSYQSNTGDWPLAGFSPRKQSLTLYVMEGNEDSKELLAKLGKYKASGSCLYINKLADVDQKILAKLIETSFQYAKKNYNRKQNTEDHQFSGEC